MCFANTRRSEEHKHAYRLVGVFEAEAAALYGFHEFGNRRILANNGALQSRLHFEQPHTFGLRNALHRHASHHCHDFSHFVGIDSLTVFSHFGLPFFSFFVKLLVYFGGFVAKSCCLGEIVTLGCGHFFSARFL